MAAGSSPTTPPVILVAGVGNIFCSDDGFGPAMASRLGARAFPGGVSVVDYGIRGLHLAYDLLDGYDALVLVDAIPATLSGSGPGEVCVLEVDTGAPGAPPQPRWLDAHSMDPVAVLTELRRLGGTPPPTYVVGCVPHTTEEGIGLSEPVTAALPEAERTVCELLDLLTAPTVHEAKEC